MSKNPQPTIAGDVSLTTGPYGQPDGAYYFPGKPSGYIEIPKQSKTDVRFNVSFFTWIYNQGTYAPILNYETDVYAQYGLHVFVKDNSVFYGKLVTRDNTKDVNAVEENIAKDAWTFVGFTHDYSVGKVRIYIDGVLKKEVASPKHELNTKFK
ncbi:uncharacterized protein LOC110247574, partial [Exaiptasia diaphana]|uniref:LamG domain-containing protein n=1 Tax=Exaiptasia diaphana TaxID=2652724 RepID=A0A913XSU2_EXADI